MNQSNARLTLDWFPWPSSNGLFASIGVTHLDDPAQLSATADTSLNYSLGGVLYSGAQLGSISGTVETETNLPYIGLGYQYNFGRKQGGRGAFIQAEVGTTFKLDTRLKLSSSNPNNLGQLNTHLQAYATQQNEKFEDKYTVYGLTVGYRF